jgi:hypothetical protein
MSCCLNSASCAAVTPGEEENEEREHTRRGREPAPTKRKTNMGGGDTMLMLGALMRRPCRLLSTGERGATNVGCCG